jgi:hypothetical protein
MIEIPNSPSSICGSIAANINNLPTPRNRVSKLDKDSQRVPVAAFLLRLVGGWVVLIVVACFWGAYVWSMH